MVRESRQRPFFGLVLWSFVALVCLYLASGAWPLYPVFGDGMAIASGAEEIKRSGLGPNPLTYWYSQHPGAHVLPAAVSIVTGLDTMRSLLVLVVLGSVMSVACATALIARLLPIAWPVALVSVLLFQESWVSGYYGNSTVLAAGFAFGALFLVLQNRGLAWDVAAGLAFAAAGLMRLDAVVTAPAAVVLILLAGRHDAIRRLAVIAAVSGFALTVSLYLLGFDPDEVSASLAFKEQLFEAEGDLDNTMRSLVAFISVLCLLLMASGLLAFWRSGRKDLLALIALGVLPTALVFSSGLDTPRYLFYTLPFAAMLVAGGLNAAWPARGLASYLWLALLLAAFAGQYLLSSGLVAADTPRSGLVLATLPTSDPDRRVRAIVIPPALLAQPVIGLGNNGGRLGTGLAMSPRWYGNNKRRFGERAEEMRTILRRAGEAGHPVMSLGWDSVQLALHSLLLDGFVLAHHEREPDWRSERFEFESQGARVDFTFYRYSLLKEARRNGIDAVIRDPVPGTVLVVSRFLGREMGVEDSGAWAPVGDGIYVRVR